MADHPLLEVSPPSVRLAAVKEAEVGGRLIVRLVGPATGEPTRATVTLWRPVGDAHLSDLDERSGPGLPVVDLGGKSQVTVDVPARDVVTLSIQSD